MSTLNVNSTVFDVAGLEADGITIHRHKIDLGCCRVASSLRLKLIRYVRDNDLSVRVSFENQTLTGKRDVTSEALRLGLGLDGSAPPNFALHRIVHYDNGRWFMREEMAQTVAILESTDLAEIMTVKLGWDE